MNEKQIQTLLMRKMLVVRKHVAAVPNSTRLLQYEVDLLTVTKAGLVHEFEIKRTMSDYRADFKNKSKHYFFVNSITRHNCPNYFWFVTLFNIDPPKYAGWIKIKVGEKYPVKYKKEAPRLHGKKWDGDKVARIARLLSFRLLKEYEL